MLRPNCSLFRIFQWEKGMYTRQIISPSLRHARVSLLDQLILPLEPRRHPAVCGVKQSSFLLHRLWGPKGCSPPGVDQLTAGQAPVPPQLRGPKRPGHVWIPEAGESRSARHSVVSRDHPSSGPSGNLLSFLYSGTVLLSGSFPGVPDSSPVPMPIMLSTGLCGVLVPCWVISSVSSRIFKGS